MFEEKINKRHFFGDVEIEDQVGQDTGIPHLQRNASLFFASYTQDQFE